MRSGSGCWSQPASCLARPLPCVCERSGARQLNSLQTRHSLALDLQRPSGPDLNFLLLWERDAAGGPPAGVGHGPGGEVGAREGDKDEQQ